MELGLNRAKGCPLGYCPGIKRGTKVVLQELDMHIALGVNDTQIDSIQYLNFAKK